MPGKSLRIAAMATLCGAILLPAAAAAQAAREPPTWARAGSILSIAHDECLARAVLAAKTQGLVVVSNSGGVVVARKAPNLAIMTCAFTADSKIDLNVVVVSNGDRDKDAVVLRDALQEETRKSSCRPTPWGFQHCYGREAKK